jgi:hypothetical protein
MCRLESLSVQQFCRSRLKKNIPVIVINNYACDILHHSEYRHAQFRLIDDVPTS